MGKLYIAYGSNLNLAQMAARCPSARVYAKGARIERLFLYHKSYAHSMEFTSKDFSKIDISILLSVYP